VPFPTNPCFTGREQLLEELEKTLHPKLTAAIAQPQAVHGLGGVGKTQLMVEYAWKHHSEYDAVLWVTANSPDAVTANLAALAGAIALNLPEAAASDQASQVQAVLRWLRENRRWLLIFDNADTEEAVQAIRTGLPPVLKGHVLITSRRSNWPMGIHGMPIEVLDVRAAIHFLNQRTDSLKSAGSLEMLEAVAKELGCLPLALEQAAAYVLRHRIDWQRYLELLSARREELLAFRSEGGTQYPQSVAATWLVSQQKLSVAAQAILRLVSFLAPEEAPRRLFTEGESILKEAVGTLEAETGQTPGLPATTGWVDEALAELADYSLITLNPRTLSCHHLVQVVLESQIPSGSHRQWVCLVLELLERFAPARPHDVRTWPVWNVLWAHVERVINLADRFGIANPTTFLMNQLGLYLLERALFTRAETSIRRALAIDERIYGPDHPEVASFLNNLAQLLKATNQLGEAEPLMRRALAIDEQGYGPTHPDVARDLNNLAPLLQDTDRLGEAEPLMCRALAIDEQSYSPNHPAVARDLNNLAALLRDTNRLGEAEPLMRRALAIDEQSYGRTHPDVARDLNNLAQLLQDTNRLGEAEPLMRRALAIDEQSYGPNHPNVATGLNNLAQLLATNRLAEAEPLMRRALLIDEQSYGPKHPKVAIRLNNLAALLRATNRLEEAEPLMHRTLAIDEQSYGQDHPKVATDLYNLAQLLQATNRLGEAEPLMRRALAIDEQSYGPNHPDVAIDLNNLAQLLKATNRLGEAEPLMRRALAIFQSSLGPDHPNTQTVRQNLGQLRS
jgi:tetratricopeptide (TPR) repeat protein